MSIDPIRTNISEIWIKTRWFSLKQKCTCKCHLRNGGHFISATIYLVSSRACNVKEPHGRPTRLPFSPSGYYLITSQTCRNIYWTLQYTAAIILWMIWTLDKAQSYIFRVQHIELLNSFGEVKVTISLASGFWQKFLLNCMYAKFWKLNKKILDTSSHFFFQKCSQKYAMSSLYKFRLPRVT